MIQESILKTNVLVLGSGPAGFSAAYIAAKHGAQVILVEQSGDVGGIATSGLMSHWTGSCNSPLYYEILKRSADLNDGKHKGQITRFIDPEKLKILLLEMLDEVGVKLFLYSFAEDAIMDGNKVLGASIINKSGRIKIYADTVIDATGDGDIAARAGIEFNLGREEDHKMQPATIMFKVGGVDYSKAAFLGSFETKYETEKGELQALAKQILPHPAGHVLLYRTTLPGVVTCNMTNCINVDGTNALDLTKATITCRKQIKEIIEFLKEYVPGYENCFLLSSASLIGVRETRHFKGLYTLTEHDILEAKVFDDYVVKDASFNFDIHNIDGSGLDKNGVQKNFTQKKGYTIPYRCFIPEFHDNILLCGRNISGTHIAHSNYRVMPICVGMGEACGAAAALASKLQKSVREITAGEIRNTIF